MQVDSLELSTVRELGCGDGRFTYLYAHDADFVLGIDPDRAEIRKARRDRPAELVKQVRFRVAKTVSPPRRRFDVALLSWSL